MLVWIRNVLRLLSCLRAWSFFMDLEQEVLLVSASGLLHAERTPQLEQEITSSPPPTTLPGRGGRASDKRQELKNRRKRQDLDIVAASRVSQRLHDATAATKQQQKSKQNQKMSSTPTPSYSTPRAATKTTPSYSSPRKHVVSDDVQKVAPIKMQSKTRTI